jgi:twitching motility protein PilT
LSDPQRQLADALIAEGLITSQQLDMAATEGRRTGETPWKVLLDRGILGEADLVRTRARQVGLPFVDLQVEAPAPEALKAIPVELARKNLMLPMRFSGGKLVVAMAEPQNHVALGEAQRAAGREVVAAAAARSDLEGAIGRAFAHEPQVSVAVTAGVPGGQVASHAFDAEDLPMVESVSSEPMPPSPAPADKDPSLADFLNAVITSGASDLHMTSGLPPMLRIHGELRPIEGYRMLLPKDLQEIIYSMLTQKQREVFEEHLELDMSYSLPGRGRFRVNVFQQRDSMGAVMRMIPFEIRSLDELGVPQPVKEFARLRRGLVLVTGVTGSGKSTTLAGLIDIVNSTRAEHIMTVEDPIEFLHKHKRSIVNQREVGADTHGFAAALRHVLRQDPDVILVGELRDLETIQTALSAAETGHLVFATLHTQDAPQSVDRIIDVFPPYQQEQIRIQLAGTLAGVVSQQLVPRADHSGRIVACELLIATDAVRNLIREGKTHQIYSSMQSGGKFGMQVMDQNLADLVKAGAVTYEMALERCHHVEEFNRLAGKA